MLLIHGGIGGLSESKPVLLAGHSLQVVVFSHLSPVFSINFLGVCTDSLDNRTDVRYNTVNGVL